ncbi:MAG: A/G-specific adenine glycosylase, partial [Syntrophobacteraceae bacterium]|nr:A/G-specific adenine glycosylase [Syntrophobacteraceae bacterium]
MLSDRECTDLQRILLDWFQEYGRDLPWRKTHSPYEVWISEMMLQQTQVKTMLPYYHRWMETFPDVASLAATSEEEVLRHWAGLGYYSRAINLHRAAQILVREHGGHLPRDHEALLKLPGIGRYSAGAVMSIAFNEDFPVVDGNVERILARLFNVASPVKEGEGR